MKVLLVPLFCVILLCAVGVSVSYAASEVYVSPVGDDTTGDGTAGNPYKTIGKGVSIVDAAGTVHVAAGTYNERVTINKSLTLLGAQAGIDPTAAGARTTPAAESIITEAGLSTPNPDVLIDIPAGVTHVTIDGFTLSGDPTNPTSDTSTIRAYDDYIVVRNNILSGYNVLLYKGNDHFTAEYNRITANKTGIVVQPNAATDITLRGNVIVPGTAPAADAQGIYLSAVNGASVVANSITGFVGANGLAGSNLTNINIKDNTVNGNKKGINFWGTTSFIRIVNNQVSGNSAYGISIKGNDITITGNTVTGNGTVGVAGNGGIIISKDVLNTERVTVRYNTITGNANNGLEVTAAVVQSVAAEYNWWGDASGPSGAGSGSGDAVSGNADYTPWAAGELPLGESSYTVTPPMLAAGKPQFCPPHGTGENPFGYDWDSARPETRAGAPAGYGASSFYAHVVQGAPTPAERYRTLRLGMRTLFGRNVAISEITSITYQTKKPAPASAIDWRLSIYTTPADQDSDPDGLVLGPGDASKWYRNRIQSHPSNSLNLNAPADTWNLWTTAAGTNQMQFGCPGTSRTGFTAEDITFAELAAGPVTRSGNTWDFSGEEVMMIDVLLGANSGGGTGESQLDAIRIELSSGQVADIDLSAGSAWQVATVHGISQFTISDDQTQLLYAPQPRNTRGWYWYNNNGSAPGVLATGGLAPGGYRDGSRTFAATDVAVGQKLSDLKLTYEYKTALGYVTMNFFITDGQGHFGIFSPASGGIGWAQMDVLPDGWTRLTLDLTQPIDDSATPFAIYEQNGLSNEHGEPFTVMNWGAIKNCTIAGMYDYQRSPANGWQSWGAMFDAINEAGSSTLVNGYGLALIWGDTVGNTTYTTQPREVRNVVISFGGVDYVGTFADAQISDLLELNVAPAGLYVKPGETVNLDVGVLNLSQEVAACQMLLGYDSAYLGSPSVMAGDSPWTEFLWGEFPTPGKINAGIGVVLTGGGTILDGTVAHLSLVAGGTIGVTQAETQVVFLPDVDDLESTFLVAMDATPVWPTKRDSQRIVIDGVNPIINVASAVQGGQELLGASVNAVQGTVTITVTASDAWAGLAARPVVTVQDSLGGSVTVVNNGENLLAGEFYYTATITSATANGTATITATVSDLAGNSASDSDTFTINKNQITGLIELQGFVGAERTVTFVATAGATTKTWTVNVTGFAGAVANYTLTDVPDGVTALSAKTAWNLRRKLAVGGGANNQWTADFTGVSMLRGGDLNGTNSVNTLDYTVLKTRWFTTNPVADINGDGVVKNEDYIIMNNNWLKAGDPQ